LKGREGLKDNGREGRMKMILEGMEG